MKSIIDSPVLVLIAFCFFLVGNEHEVSIYLWYIINEVEYKGVDAVLGLAAIFFMLSQWIIYELNGQLLMYRIMNIICGGLMITSLILFVTYDNKQLPYGWMSPLSYVSAFLFFLLVANFMYVQFRRFHRH